MTETSTQRYTPEDLLRMPNGKSYELVGGELLEKPKGFKASFVAGQIHALLAEYCRKTKVGISIPEGSYQCFAIERNRVRVPDVSFLQRDRIPTGGLPDGHCRIAPDLAVEVISPNEEYYEVEAKVDEYLNAGVKLVWVVEPNSQTVRVHRHDGTVADFTTAMTITGENVVTGFQCTVAEFFASPTLP